jgi:hypothetical protein
MGERNRRDFLVEVGQGMLVALIGPGLAADMGLASRSVAEEPVRPTLENLERLVGLLQETPPNQLVPAVLGQLQKGVTLRDLVAAGAVANARAFAGHDYDGYHTFMAMAPAFAMGQELPEKERAIPIIKVLHRNGRTMGSGPGKSINRLKDVEPAEVAGDPPVGKRLLDASRAHRIEEADRLFLAAAKGSLQDGYNDLLPLVQDDLNVHRVVLAWRSWETIDFTGQAHARTLLRQSIHFCCDDDNRNRQAHAIQAVLPQLMDKYRLMDKPVGKRTADDAWVDRLAQTIYAAKREEAAEAVAAALAEGHSPEVIGEAMSVACARLVLGDAGREKQHHPDKPLGSVHGDSVGVHASDAANAWRHIARVSNPRNTFASLVAGAYHTAGQTARQMKERYPQAADLEPIRETDAAKLLSLTEEAIRAKDQRRTCALAERYGQQRHDARALFQLLLRYAVSEDGALHAEKYYRTVTEEFTSVRPAFRWQHLVALSRVTASLYGKPAPGVEEARKLLG